MDPSMVFMIGFTTDTDELKETMRPLKITTRKLIFMPVNNNRSMSQVGGTHWTLLVYNRSTDEFSLYDSMVSMSGQVAHRIANHIYPVLEPKGWNKKKKPVIKRARTPQQLNTWDCGCYVMAISEYLTRKDLGLTSQSIDKEVTPSAVANKR